MSPPSVKYILFYEDVVQSLLNIHLYDACSLILTELYTKFRNLVKKTSCLRLIYHTYILFGVALK